MEPARRQGILLKAEKALKRTLERGAPEREIQAAVERVRAAKLLHFKGQREIARYLEPLSPSDRRHLTNLKRRMDKWNAMTLHEILTIYRQRWIC